MNIFEKRKISLLKQKIEAHKIDAHNHGRFSLFDAKFAVDSFNKTSNYDSAKSYYEIIEEWDGKCNLSYEVGISLDKLATDNTVMIHRTRLGLDTTTEGLVQNYDLFCIMNDGLKNHGHGNAIGGSAFSDTPPALTLTMTPLNGLSGYVNLLASYKANDVIIVAAFPKELVNDEGDITQGTNYHDIYDLSGSTPRVKKDYMVGAILKKDNGFDEFYLRDEVIMTGNSVKTSETDTVGKSTQF